MERTMGVETFLLNRVWQTSLRDSCKQVYLGFLGQGPSGGLIPAGQQPEGTWYSETTSCETPALKIN